MARVRMRGGRGLKVVQRNLASAIKAVGGGTLEGCRAAAEETLAATLPKTPVETGELRASGTVTDNGNPENPLAVVAFTDPKAPIVHERNFDYKHGRWKFLESTTNERERDILRRIAESARVE